MRRALTLIALLSCLPGCTGAPTASSEPSAGAVASLAPTAKATTPNFTNPPATPIPGCLPQCWFGEITRPGALEGEYQTRNFFGGQMTVKFPNGWFGYEDSTGELAAGLPNDDFARMEFWIDVYATTDEFGTRDDAVERTGDAVKAWFLDKKIIKVIERSDTTLGGIPAESIEYRRNDKAKTEIPDCPPEIQPCANAFGYPEWDGSFGEGGPFHSRLTIANATWGGQPHTIYVMFWATDPNYDQMIGQVDGVIASVQLPEGVEPG